MTTNEQVELYCKQMTEEKALNKANKKLNEEIKQTLIDSGDTDIKSGIYSVHLETRVSEGIDEARALSILKTFWSKDHGDEMCPFIRTVFVLDMDALEGALYNNAIPDEVLMQLDSCRTKKETKALTFKVAKEK